MRMMPDQADFYVRTGSFFAASKAKPPGGAAHLMVSRHIVQAKLYLLSHLVGFEVMDQEGARVLPGAAALRLLRVLLLVADPQRAVAQVVREH